MLKTLNSIFIILILMLANSSFAAKRTNKSLVDLVKQVSLQGELFLEQENGQKLDLGKYFQADEVSGAIIQKRLMKLGMSLSNRSIVKKSGAPNSKETVLAFVNQTTLGNPDKTQYLYFENLEGIEFGIFKIKGVSVNLISLESETAAGKKETLFLKKRTGSFLPF